MGGFFTSHPLGTFLAGLVLGGCAMGGAAAYYRQKFIGQMRFSYHLLDDPALYRRVRDGEWLKISEATAAHAAAVKTEK